MNAPDQSRNFKTKRHFTFVEILMAIIIVMILLAITMPLLSRSMKRSKFVRWYAFNRALANDPTCVVNFNFQEGEGDKLNNICSGADVKNYDQTKYCGYLSNNNGGKHNFQWISSGGRWGKYGYKNALQFNGVDTYIHVPGSQGLDFTPADDFTILCWVKFDKIGLGDCPFSKSLWGTEADAAAQYDMYSNPYAGTFGQGSFDVDVFTTCATWESTKVDFDKAGWVHLVLRYESTGMDTATGEYKGRTSVFVNGKTLGPWISTTDENPNTASATGWKACAESGINVPLIIGGAGCYRKYWSPGTYNPGLAGQLKNEWLIKFFFKGKMDEFLLFKRALTDLEIMDHYQMGKE